MKKSYKEKLVENMVQGIMGYIIGAVLLHEQSHELEKPIAIDVKFLEKMVQSEVEYGLTRLEKRLANSVKRLNDFVEKEFPKMLVKSGMVLSYDPKSKVMMIKKDSGILPINMLNGGAVFRYGERNIFEHIDYLDKKYKLLKKKFKDG